MPLPGPLLRVTATWFWVAIMTVFLLTSPSTVHWFSLRPYFAAYVEILFVGLIPVLFTTLGREEWSRYGVTGRGLSRSLAWSLAFLAAERVYSRLSTGHWLNVSHLTCNLSPPAKVYYAFLGVFAYGPLEMFFVIWLAINTEQILQSKKGGFLMSLSITAALFALMHILFQGFSAASVAVPFVVLGLIFRWTKNSIGPMLGWTLLNQQVWFLASLLWS